MFSLASLILTLLGPCLLVGMAVSANQIVPMRNNGDRIEMPVASSKHLYQHTMVFEASGYATDVINTGSNPFMGIAVAEYDNSSGSNGGVTAELWQRGLFLLTGSGFAQGDVGTVVYASDNFTITKTSTNNTKIGRIEAFQSSTQVWVRIDTVQT